MVKRNFYSQLFRRNIEKTEKDYLAKVKAELLFRIYDLQTKKCSCINCQNDLEKYVKYYKKISGL